MLYDVLDGYRAYLSQKLRPNSVRTYYNRLESLLEGQSLIDTIEKLDISKILVNLSKIQYKNQFSQSKNALLYFLSFINIAMNDEQMKIFKVLEMKTRKKYRKMKQINYREIDKKIRYIKNQKLKLCYKTLLATGLRVSEIAQITPSNCYITNNKIILYFIGKGGNKENVSILTDEHPKLYEELKCMIEATGKTKKVFYSANYLQQKAKKLNFHCHDLRRIFAKQEYKKTKSRKYVSKKLRHTNIKTTNIYLRSKIKF